MIPDAGLSSTRFWPMSGCDKSGDGFCEVGSSGGPGQGCPPDGCAPPVDSKFEATFGCEGAGCPAGTSTVDWWDTSAVDGYTFPYTLALQGCPQGKSLDCSQLKLSDCPQQELTSSGMLNLSVTTPAGAPAGCYSPCGKLTFSNWGNPGTVGPADAAAALYCCPTPPVSSPACNAGPVVDSSFVKLIHEKCKDVYAFAYDDGVGLQTCPPTATYTWTVGCLI